MTYPCGEIIKIGDLIWINEGSQQGLVADVVEDRVSMASHGLDDFGIFVAFSRPTESPHSRDLFIGQRFFEDEGIGPVAPHEPQLL